MKTIFRNGALALALIAGSALVTAPAMADRDRGDHHWKKSWKHERYDRDGRWDRGRAYYHHRHHRHHHRRYYGWGPRYPGFSLYIR